MLKPLTSKIIQSLTNSRAGETKLGDTISLISKQKNWQEEIKAFHGKYCLVGIPEDIGPIANLGKGGAAGGFMDFLSYFLNMQDNGFLSGGDILLAGTVELDDLMEKAKTLKNTNPKDLIQLRLLVDEIDNRVFPIIKTIVAAGKIPITIGGGHNNAYPLLKGSYLGLGKKAMGAINIDPHADIRALEGRHSGNGFSYAIADGYLEKYHPIGLHKNYNNEYTWEKLKSDKHLFKYVTHEDILFKAIGTKELITKALKFLKGMPFGIEIDLDGIKFTESSAKTPVGLSESKVRKMLNLLASDKNIVYLNLSEGIPSANGQTGKLIAYLVADFIRASTL